jgi:hypothetical protein
VLCCDVLRCAVRAVLQSSKVNPKVLGRCSFSREGLRVACPGWFSPVTTGTLWLVLLACTSQLYPAPACSYAASYVYIEQLGGWRWMYGLAALPAVVLAAGATMHGLQMEGL